MDTLKTFPRLLLCLLIFTMGSNAVAQRNFRNYDFDTSKTYMIKLFDGSEFVSKFLHKDSLSLTIKTNSVSRIEIPFNKIRTIDPIDDMNMKKGVYWFPNPNATRYFFAPSAFALKKGEGYYQNSYLFLNSFSVGVTNNFSVGGGLEIISSVLGEPIFFVTPKLSFKVAEKFHTGVGVLYANVPTFASDGRKRASAGIIYGLGTYGTTDKNLTGGLGWGFFEGDFSARPVITLSGMTRVSRRIALVSENYFIPTDSYYGIFSYGVRFFGEKISVDLGFINNKDIVRGIPIGVPYVDFVIKFD